MANNSLANTREEFNAQFSDEYFRSKEKTGIGDIREFAWVVWNTALAAQEQQRQPAAEPVFRIDEGPGDHRPRVATQIGDLPPVGAKLYARAGINKSLEQVHKFLLGEDAIDHCHFGERPDGAGGFWWRQHLRDAIKAQAQPAAGQVSQQAVAMTDKQLEKLAEDFEQINYESGTESFDVIGFARALLAANSEGITGSGK